MVYVVNKADAYEAIHTFCLHLKKIELIKTVKDYYIVGSFFYDDETVHFASQNESKD
ncbi:hypothetical protein [Bartonella sp. B17]